MLLDCARDGQRSLCVWGAGPCNDLQLDLLCRAFRQVVLVDLDGDTVRQGLACQARDGFDQLSVAAPIDLSGILSLLGQYREDPSPTLADRIRQQAGDCRIEELGQFDVVVSTCLFSQIVDSVRGALGEGNPLLFDLLPVLRQRHLELLVEHANAGGRAILVTDVTSSDALQEMTRPDADLPDLLRNQVCTGNHFHGLNPLVIDQSIRTSRIVAERVGTLRVSSPWLWDAVARQYLCLAYMMELKPEAAVAAGSRSSG